MATGLDELVEQLLYDVALSGTQGVGAEELERAVKAFYSSHQRHEQSPQPENEEDLLFSNALPSNTSVVDDNLLDAVWDWLEKHPDIEIRPGNDTAPQLEPAEADYQEARNEVRASSASDHAGKRIFTNKERIWQVITGHGVDYSRLPKTMFDCLSVIAAHGPEGVLQPAVTKLTGQDKRSVPKRTDKLAAAGYITKDPVIGAGTKTCLLKLRRFATDESLCTSASRPEHAKAYPKAKETVSQPVIHYDVWYNETMRLLRDNNNIITYEDLRLGLNIPKGHWYIRAWRRCINRLVTTGCARKLKARVEGGAKNASTDKWMRCLQLMREPVQADYAAFVGEAGSAHKERRRIETKDQDEVDDDDMIENVEAELDDDDMIEVVEDQTVVAKSSSNRIVPQWTPDLPYTNLVFNIIDNAGPKGISSMELSKRSMGQLWRRPLDEIVQRLTDVWQHSQPSHLRHLTVVRDTGMEGKQSHFLYRTLPNFERAVEMGLTEWAAILVHDKPNGKGKGKQNAFSSSPPDLDAWGFTRLNPKLLAGNDGRASLLECQAAARKEAGLLTQDDDVADANEDSPAGIIPSPTTLKSGRKKRKDAGVRRGPRNMLNTPEFSNKRTADTAQLDSPVSTNKAQRVGEVHSLSPLRPGLHINPPGAKEKRFENHRRAGNKPRAIIAVFKSERLNELEWFGHIDASRTDDAPTSTVIQTGPVPLDSVEEDQDDDGRSTKRRKLIQTSGQVTPFPRVPNMLGIDSSPQGLDSSTWRRTLGTNRFGRVSTSKYSEEEPQTPVTRGLRTLLDEKAPPAIPSASDAFTADIELSATRKSIRGRLSNDDTEVVENPKASETEMNIATQRHALSTPAQPLVSTLQTPSTGATMPKKKRGRPSKADIAERERLKKIQESADTAIGSTQAKASTGQDEGKPRLIVRLSLPRAPKQTNGEDSLVQDSGSTPKKVVKLPLPNSLRTETADSVVVAANTSHEPGQNGEQPTVEPAAGADNVDPAQPNDHVSKASLIAKLPLPPSSNSSDPEPQAQNTALNGSASPGGESLVALGLTIVRPYASSQPSSSLESAQLDGSSMAAQQSSERHNAVLNPIVPEEVQRRSSSASACSGSATRQTTYTHNTDKVDETSEPQKVSASKWATDTGVKPTLGSDLGSRSRRGNVPNDDSDMDDDYRPSSDKHSELSELREVEVEDNFSYKERLHAGVGLSRQGGIIHLRRQNIVLEELRKAGGVFPGDQAIWYPFVTAWQKSYQGTPDRNTVENAVNLLIKEKKMKKFAFSFKDSTGKTIQRHLIAEPQIDPTSAKAKKVQKQIYESWPSRFLPKQVTITHDLREKARTIPAARVRKKGSADLDSEDEEVIHGHRGAQQGPNEYWGTFLTTNEVMVKRTAEGLAEVATLKAQRPAQKPGNKNENDGHDFDSSYGFDVDTDLDLSDTQTTMQFDFQLGDYQHQANKQSRLPQRMRPRSSLTVGRTVPPPQQRERRTPRRVIQQLMQSVQVFHAPSGTFGTLGKSLLKNTTRIRPNFPIVDQDKIFSLPASLDDILEKAQMLGYQPACPSDSFFYKFQHEVDMVQAYEKEIIESGRSIGTRDRLVFIDHGLNCPHVQDTQANHLPIEFVDGAVKPATAEKTRQHPLTKGPGRPGKPSTAGVSQTPRMPRTPRKDYKLLNSGRDLTSALPDVHAGYSEYSNSTSHPSEHPAPLLVTSTHPSPSPATAIQTKFPIPSPVHKPGRPYVYKPKQKAKQPTFSGTAISANVSANIGSEMISKLSSKNGFRKVQGVSKASGPFKDYKILSIALALTRMLRSGLKPNQSDDWNLIAHAMGSKYDAITLLQHWRTRGKGGYNVLFVEKLQDAIHEPFLKAYETGELPTIDFDSLENTDWSTLIGWVDAEILPLDKDVEIQYLPSSRHAIDVSLQLGKHSSDKFSAYVDDPTESQSADRTREDNHDNFELDQQSILEKSWIRAVTATKDDKYSEREAVQKVSKITSSKLEKLIKEMLDTNTLVRPKKDRQLPGRNYHLSNFVLSQFQRWPASTDDGSNFLKNVARTSDDLVKHFRDHDYLEIDSDVTETHMLVLTNMVAQGHLRISPILPERNDDFDAPWPKLSKWGQAGDLQDGKEIDTTRFLVKVMYKKTPAYTEHQGLKLDVALPVQAPLFDGESDFRTPFWIDIHGDVIGDVWEMVVSSILHLVVYTPGCTVHTMERAHNAKLWAWEIEMVLEWMEEVGTVVKVEAGREDGMWNDGWRAGEWWYCTLAPSGS